MRVAENCSSRALPNGQEFVGVWKDVSEYSSVVVALKTDTACKMYLDLSPDAIFTDSTLTYDVDANVNEVHRVSITRAYARLRVLNDSGSNQTLLRLSMIVGEHTQLTSNLNTTIQSDADALVTRAILMSQTPEGEFTTVGNQRPMPIAIRNPLTGFGELQVAENTPYIQGSGVYEFIPTNFREFTALGGTTGVTDRMFTVTSGTDLNGYGAIQSFRSLNYKPGQGGLARFTALFQNSTANHWSGVGLVNLSDELSFGYNGTAFGIWHRRNGVAEVRTITVTGASGGSTNLTLVLNSVTYTIPLTSGTTAFNAYQIAEWLNTNQGVWSADQVGATVIVSALSDSAKAGTYSYTHATSTGTIAQNKAGVFKTSDHIPQASWNVHTFPDLDPTKGNVFQIQYQYLGFGNIFYSVENPDTGIFELAHIIKYANANTTPSLRQPALRFGMYSASLASTTNVTVQCASVACFVQGRINKIRNPRAVKNTQVVSTTFTNVLTLRNRRTYNSITNQVEIEPINLTISSESSKNVEIEIRTNAIPSGATNFIAVGTNLVSDIDTTVNTITGGTLLTAFTLGSTGNISIDLIPFEIAVPPTLRLTISARVTSGANANVTAALTYYEDI